MRFMGCPSGGMMHRFDKVTHRCRCGRWQAGFAPKKEPVKPRDECQICERKQACDKDGTLGHHGYTRPGWGFIHGDCPGEGHKPYPATDALEKYLVSLDTFLERTLEALVELPTVTELPYSYIPWEEYRKNGRKGQQTTVQVPRGGEFKENDRSCGVSFKDLERRQRAKLENDISFGAADRKRVVERITKAKEMVTV